MTRSRLKKGSNQYKDRPRFIKGGTYLTIFWIVSLVALPISMIAYGRAYAESKSVAIVSPLALSPEIPQTYELSANEVKSWEGFKKAAYEVASIHDYPVKVIIAQAALESARGTSKYAKERSNYFGMTCFDRDPEKYCSRYDNAKQSIISYMQLIKNKYPVAYSHRDDPVRMVKEIKKAGYATDPHYVAKVISIMNKE
jgi:flagellum-specific peptidoglycan hydrolase FlgJ